MLTTQQMNNAYYATMMDSDGDGQGNALTDGYSEVYGYCHIDGSPTTEQECRERANERRDQYLDGKEVLKRYRVKQTQRTTIYTYVNGKFPGEDDPGVVNCLRVFSGYIGTMQAYRTVLFFDKEQDNELN